MKNQETNLNLPSNKELGLLVLQTLVSLKDRPTFKEIRVGLLRLATKNCDFEENQLLQDHFRSFKTISKVSHNLTNMLRLFEKIGFVQELPSDKWGLTSGFIDVFSHEALNEIYDVNNPLGSRSIKDLLPFL